MSFHAQPRRRHAVRFAMRGGVPPARLRLVWRVALWLALGAARAGSADTTLDDFEDLKGWIASTSQGATLEIAHDTGRTGMSMRLDFDFRGGSGYVIARKAIPISLPANYAFAFQMRAEAPANNLEFKLVDRGGQNVWWHNRRELEFPREWQSVVIKKRRLDFAWGPAGGGAPKQIGYVEFALSAANGGRGSVWIDDFRLEEREPVARAEATPGVRASTFVPGHEPERVIDLDARTSWRSGAVAADQWLLIDFRKRREYGGLIVDWDPEDYATTYCVEVSDDGTTWAAAIACGSGNGGRDYVYLPDGESRYIRLSMQASSRGQGYAIRAVAVKPFEFSASPNQFFAALAADAPPGMFPKYFSERQTYWTLIGASGDDKEALMNEEGMIEVDKGAFSIEPFVFADGRLIAWSMVQISQALEGGYLPIPSVTWKNHRMALTISAFAAGEPGQSVLYARYRMDNLLPARQEATLFLAIRPFQVVPPWQSLNMTGGVSPIREIAFDGRTAWVNGDRAVISLTPPDHAGAAAFDEGLLTDYLSEGRVPPHARVSDSLGYASAAMQYAMRLPALGSGEVDIAVPFHAPEGAGEALGGGQGTLDAKLAAAIRAWTSLLDRAEIRLPASAGPLSAVLKSTLAYILLNRDGAAIQPGSRNYARSWIRDGAMTSAALLQMGHTEEVREFARWFARYQEDDGRIPCCVDRRGADPVPEHDSGGEFIFTVAEYYRFTRDVGFLAEMWPAVTRTVDYLDALRAQRLTEEYQRGEKRLFYGLLPESISHEGYSAHPVHAYWDDFFAVRGFKDAAALALVVGDEAGAARIAGIRDAFHRDLYASIEATMAKHKIDYVPGSAELGDFDPSSTAIAMTLGSEHAHLPQAALARTFERYYEHVRERRRRPPKSPDAYTPYELRNVCALVRLGQRERAIELLEEFLRDRRPAAWNAWAEVVWRDPELSRFIGDMPHTWVGASFILSARALFAYEDEGERSLVLAAGVPREWVSSPEGVAVKRLPTHHGVLSYRLDSVNSNALRMVISGDLSLPPGGLVLKPPLPGPLKRVIVNGVPVADFAADRAVVGEFPAEVVLEYDGLLPK